MNDNNLELEIAKEKKMFLKKSYDAHAQAMSAFKFTVVWSDLEDHYNSMEKSIEERYKLLEEREKSSQNELDLIKVELAKLSQEVQLKKGELSSIEISIVNRSSELEQKGVELCSVKDEQNLVKNSVEELSKELRLTKVELAEVSQELHSKKVKLSLIENSIRQCSRELEQKRVELASVKDERNCVKNSVEELSKELHLAKEELLSMQNSIEEKSAMISRQKDELNSVKNSLEELSKELHLRINEFLQQDSIREFSATVNLQKDELFSVRNSVEQKNAKKDKLQPAEGSKQSDLTYKRRKHLKSKEKEYNELSQARSELTVKHVRQQLRMFDVSEPPFGELLGSAETPIIFQEKNEQSEDSVELYEVPVRGLESKKVQCLCQSSCQNQPLQKRPRSEWHSEQCEELKLGQVTQKLGT